MRRPERYGYLMPFPRIPDSMGAKYSHNDLSLRPFGLFESDLEVDFHQKIYPHVVTQILACCTRDKNGDTPDQTFFWNLTIGKRIECLLTIVTLGDVSDITVRLCCLNKACQQQIEIEVSMEELANLQHQIENRGYFDIRLDNEVLSIRRPTGGDQLEWLKGSFPDENVAVKVMIQTLIVNNKKDSSNQESNISEKWVKSINDAMEELDPLVNFNLLAQCPYCGKENQYEIDLEEFSLRKLHEAQLSLLETVHRLAIYYHWSEQQIFSIPPWRRSHYLSLIEKEEDR